MAEWKRLPSVVLLELCDAIQPSYVVQDLFTTTTTDAELSSRLQSQWLTAFHLSLVCTRFREVITPVLYHRISIHGGRTALKLASLLRFLVKHPNLASGVRQLILNLEVPDAGFIRLSSDDFDGILAAARGSQIPVPQNLDPVPGNSNNRIAQKQSQFGFDCASIRYLLEISLYHMRGLRELGLAQPWPLFTSHLSALPTTFNHEVEGMDRRVLSENAKYSKEISSERSALFTLPHLTSFAVRPSYCPLIAGLDFQACATTVGLGPNITRLYLSTDWVQMNGSVPSRSLESVTDLTLDKMSLVPDDFASIVESCGSLETFKYLPARDGPPGNFLEIEFPVLTYLLRHHDTTANTLRTLCITVHQVAGYTYSHTETFLRFPNLENLWIEVWDLRSQRDDDAQYQGHALYRILTTLPRSIRRIHLKGALSQLSTDLVFLAQNTWKYPQLRVVEIEARHTDEPDDVGDEERSDGETDHEGSDEGNKEDDSDGKMD
ncbi:hypothetical protein CDEST_15031 [Colletotrichum destructivum]|uniref:F-box domain-containing protein n=1 Tax=Colletotrichum destructivum TaxID=34406 RepID=A0AAX4J3S9_9PEZI|nr:hypothetical protein CDEST_15031 [Colletotrichum destructivum]